MSKILIIPDVHGRTFWKHAIECVDSYEKIVFLGDYLDPYPHEGILFQQAVDNFEEILDFKKKNLDKVVLLLGNHDWHYVEEDFMDCSRLNRGRRSELHYTYYEKNLDLFQLVFIPESHNILFSHAGVYQEWLDKYQLSIQNLIDQDFSYHFLEDISGYRGGWNTVGSPIWADIQENNLHELVAGYYQIVGHTQLSEKPHITDKIACLDIRKCIELDLETGTLSEILTDANRKE